MSGFGGIVLQNVFLGVREKFSRVAGALARKLCGGSIVHPILTDVFVSSLRAIASPIISALTGAPRNFVVSSFLTETDRSCPAHVRLCVQRRLACSAGDKPAGARVRSPVVWIAGWRETKTLKPIDKVSLGEITSHRAVTTVNANVASKMSETEGRARNRRAKAARGAEI